eukprot:CAMPEP_0167791784 /NCGR_PEP_ID=MMETSP0111_2-20121227/12143_1 /TAXON_ID=91324 /ORGANISM="Lotharella globosa, Strain CCCM811" /LENGTH=30 /DNA_ID= /DNA_START= /DNA_END= /DNA_ORIENTATION=
MNNVAEYRDLPSVGTVKTTNLMCNHQERDE